MPPDAINFPGIFLCGVVTGVLGAMLGTGGGVFLIPLLVLVFKVPMHFAVATSIVSVIATSSAVASTNVERGIANMRLGMTLEIATALGAIGGGLTAGWLSPEALEVLFALVLLPTACFMWRGRAENAAEASNRRSEKSEESLSVGGTTENQGLGLLGGTYREEQSGRTVSYQVQRLWAGLAISWLAGNLSGLLGIGGGTFKVPALHLICAVPIKAAAATSNFMIGVTAAASAFVYYGRGEIRPRVTAAVVLGVLLGSALGVYVNRFIRAGVVRRLFALLLLAVAAEMLIRRWSSGG